MVVFGEFTIIFPFFVIETNFNVIYNGHMNNYNKKLSYCRETVRYL